MKRMMVMAVVLVSAVLAQALTPEEEAEVRAKLETLAPDVRRSTVRTWAALVTPPVTGATTSQVVTARNQLVVLAERQIKAIASTYGLTTDMTPTQVNQTFIAAFTNAGTTAAKFQVADDKAMFWTCFLSVKRLNPLGTELATNTVVTPVYGEPLIAFPLTVEDIEGL